MDTLNKMDKDEITVLSFMLSSEEQETVRFIGHQINVVDNMGHQIMTLTGILLAITTALLPNLSSLSVWSKSFVLVGSSFVLGSALINGWFVFKVTWITRIKPQEDSDTTNLNLKVKALEARNKKTTGYRIALIALLLGLFWYLASIFMIILQ